jgi:hypothetical protein
MNTALVPAPDIHSGSRLRRTAGSMVAVVARPQTYRNIAYLLLGLPLGTAWFTVLVSGTAVGVSMLAVALAGIPILWGMWHVARALANVERGVANQLLGLGVPLEPWSDDGRGNPWRRLRSMSTDRRRWREIGFLMLRFPAGIATFTAAVTALATPLAVAYAPFAARHDGDQPFGSWSQSSRLEQICSSPWAWGLVPLGAALLLAGLHLVNALARACGRWADTSLTFEAAPPPR